MHPDQAVKVHISFCKGYLKLKKTPTTSCTGRPVTGLGLVGMGKRVVGDLRAELLSPWFSAYWTQLDKDSPKWPCSAGI